MISDLIEKTYIPELLNPVLDKIGSDIKYFRNEDYIELFTAFYNKVKEKENSMITLNRINQN